MNKKKSPTWILFESGSAITIDLELYTASSKSSRPIDAYLVTECEGEFTKAARRASEAVFNIYQQTNETSPLIVGYDLPAASDQSSLTGSSGGLAFAVALAKRFFLKIDPGPVAATGEVLSGGQIGAVRGILTKIKAASKLVPQNGWLLYPKANSQEIDNQTLVELKKLGINVKAVSSISETINLLFEKDTLNHIGHTKKTPANAMAFSLLILSGLIALFAYKSQETDTIKPLEPPPKPISKDIIQNKKKISSRKTSPLSEYTPTDTQAKLSVNPKLSSSNPTRTKDNLYQPSSPDNSPSARLSARKETIMIAAQSPIEKKVADLLTTKLKNYIKSSESYHAVVTISGKIEMLLAKNFNYEDDRTNSFVGYIKNFKIKLGAE